LQCRSGSRTPQIILCGREATSLPSTNTPLHRGLAPSANPTRVFSYSSLRYMQKSVYRHLVRSCIVERQYLRGKRSHISRHTRTWAFCFCKGIPVASRGIRRLIILCSPYPPDSVIAHRGVCKNPCIVTSFEAAQSSEDGRRAFSHIPPCGRRGLIGFCNI